MSTELLYKITGPKKWVEPPSMYSFSSLRQIESCPLAWQLQNSCYDGFDRYPLRPNPAGVEGEIVHGVIEKLFRELAQSGMPVIGSEVFQKCVKQVGIVGLISHLVSDHLAKIWMHPRGAGFRLKLSVQEIHNKTIRIFREQYDKIRNNTPVGMVQAIKHSSDMAESKYNSTLDCQKLLEKHGVLTELSLRHPDLPLKGVIDFVWLDDDGVEITDFKSGSSKPEHREQLILYALLWAKNTGQIPHRAYIIYPDSSVLIEITSEILDAFHADLLERINNARTSLSLAPGRANISENCQYCQVRQMCDAYWEMKRKVAITPGYVDLEMVVTGAPADFGFIGQTTDGSFLSVVYDKDLAKMSGAFKCGEALRIIGAIAGSEALEIKPWTEVFHR